MADDPEPAAAPAEDDPLKTYREHLKKFQGHMESMGKHLDNASDTLDALERHVQQAKGDTLPQRRPIAAGPDAAGNDRSSNNRRSPLYDK